MLRGLSFMTCASLPLAIAAGCATRAAETAVGASAVDALLAGRRVTVPFAELAARVPLAADENFRIAELGRDGSSSHHVVALRGREPVHRHDRHDLLVVTLEGHGSMLLGDEERAVGPRSIVYIPRGAVHAMRNLSDGVLYGYAVFTPPFDGKDRVPVTPR
jgi:mannose-6-phosphate isomerase-like protein (cupin superfamily)